MTDDFAEKTGVARAVQALQCGEWPNMELRGKLVCLFVCLFADISICQCSMISVKRFAREREGEAEAEAEGGEEGVELRKVKLPFIIQNPSENQPM